MNYPLHVANLKKGESVSFRPKGNSMRPRIESGSLITVSPEITNLQEGDIVFCKVNGNFYVHLLKAVRMKGDKKQYLIANNHGHVNGWTNIVYGKVVKVEP